jgi:hypothetical protein
VDDLVAGREQLPSGVRRVIRLDQRHAVGIGRGDPPEAEL